MFGAGILKILCKKNNRLKGKRLRGKEGFWEK